MGGHSHSEFSGDALHRAARDTLQRAGEQWTGMRADVFDALAANSRPASAYDIADQVSQARGKRVAPNSIYRILDLFVANNLAIRVESSNAFLANAHPGCLHDCIFLVCEKCRQVIHVDDDKLTKEIRQRADREGFRTARPVIELLGTCADCLAASAQHPPPP